MRWLVLTPLILLGAGPSWKQKLRAVEKQSKALQEHGQRLSDLAGEAESAGRPHALSALRSEATALAETVDRLQAKVDALRDR